MIEFHRRTVSGVANSLPYVVVASPHTYAEIMEKRISAILSMGNDRYVGDRNRFSSSFVAECDTRLVSLRVEQGSQCGPRPDFASNPLILRTRRPVEEKASHWTID